jgi:hypothetical protein
MSRVRFQSKGEQPSSWSEAWLPKPAASPGYTGNTVVTEWLTLNCRGDWASRATASALQVSFADPEDRARAVARFGEAGAPGTVRSVRRRAG